MVRHRGPKIKLAGLLPGHALSRMTKHKIAPPVSVAFGDHPGGAQLLIHRANLAKIALTRIRHWQGQVKRSKPVHLCCGGRIANWRLTHGALRTHPTGG